MHKKADYLKLSAAVLVCLSVGWLSSFYTSAGKGQWYESINKPGFTPPGAVFGVAWTVLYVLMGAAVFLVWQRGFDDRRVKIAVTVFLIQLFLNGMWSVIFFGMHNIAAAMIEIILLWAAILFCVISFFRISKLSGWLMLPYILWVSFAAVLNFSILLLNS